MTITKQKVLGMVEGLPEKIDIDELIYRLYLRKKIESAEEDVRKGRVISHENVSRGTSEWFKNTTTLLTWTTRIAYKVIY